MKKSILTLASSRGLAICVVLSAAVFAAGCQTSGRVLDVSKSSVCPECRTETRTTPVAGLTYRKHICPGCRTITETDPYTGNVTSSVHVCDHCKAAVTACSQCAGR